MTQFTVQQFIDALDEVGEPGGRQRDFLRAHAQAKGRAATFSQLAVEVGYQSYRAINLHYGKLARRIGNALGVPNAGVSLLMEPLKPQSVTNSQWVLVMRQEFYEAMKKKGWMTRDSPDASNP